MQIQNKQASTPHHVYSTMQPPSKITVCKMYSSQYQPVKIINQKEWHMPPNILIVVMSKFSSMENLSAGNTLIEPVTVL
jgi:hypothetical protein